jgi:LmbE family N-acetylglucosaminyl deacetylase
MRTPVSITLALALSWMAPGAYAQSPVVLVVTADAADYLLAAGGTIAEMIRKGATAYVIRVTNDEKDSWDLKPEETALRTRSESEDAGAILGMKAVISMGYRAAEMADVPFTSLRDRLIVYIRHYRPSVMFIPNPYTEFDRVLDRYYTGRAAEDAWRAASLENFAPPFQDFGLRPHLTPELYYYAQPLDPARRDPESSSTFVPEVKIVDIGASFDKKLKAIQALKTINYSMTMRLKQRLTSTGRKLPALDVVNEPSVNGLVEQNVRGLAKIAARGTSHKMAEEFRYAGVSFRIPSKYLK